MMNMSSYQNVSEKVFATCMCSLFGKVVQYFRPNHKVNNYRYLYDYIYKYLGVCEWGICTIFYCVLFYSIHFFVKDCESAN